MRSGGECPHIRSGFLSYSVLQTREPAGAQRAVGSGAGKTGMTSGSCCYCAVRSRVTDGCVLGACKEKVELCTWLMCVCN